MDGEQAQIHSILPQEYCHRFNASWDSSICESKLIYPFRGDNHNHIKTVYSHLSEESLVTAQWGPHIG